MATKKKSTLQSKRSLNVLLTQEGLHKLQEEYNELVKVRRPYVIARIQRAREFGDLSENAEFDAARDEQSFIEGRIQELAEALKHVKVIEDTAQTYDFVVIGSRVLVEADGEQDEFTIVGSLEADPLNGKISNESPVGKTLLGAKVGEIVEVATPIVKSQYRIVAIQ